MNTAAAMVDANLMNDALHAELLSEVSIPMRRRFLLHRLADWHGDTSGYYREDGR